MHVSNLLTAVAEVWGIANKQARLTHLSVLLELENDDVIGELMNHVSEVDLEEV
jgi:hypothetical protein